MEKEIKDKNIILTDEELKEVAGGIDLSRAKALECARTTDVKACFEKKYCVWKDKKCYPKG